MLLRTQLFKLGHWAIQDHLPILGSLTLTTSTKPLLLWEVTHPGVPDVGSFVAIILPITPDPTPRFFSLLYLPHTQWLS